MKVRRRDRLAPTIVSILFILSNLSTRTRALAIQLSEICRSANLRPQRARYMFAVSSVQTRKLSSVFGPKVMLMATSAASRPWAISTRPMRGALLRASNVYQRPPIYASNQPEKSIGASDRRHADIARGSRCNSAREC